MRLGPKPAPFRLTHYAGDTCCFETVGENATGPSGVTFEGDENGRATSGDDRGARRHRAGNLQTVVSASTNRASASASAPTPAPAAAPPGSAMYTSRRTSIIRAVTRWSRP